MDNNFKPIKLCDLFVNHIFDSCLTKKDSKRRFTIRLQNKSCGYAEDGTAVYFDADSIKEYSSKITYLAGQLERSHSDGLSVVASIPEFFKRYDGENWTTNGNTLLKFIHLAIANRNITNFYAKNGLTLFCDICPTLTPDDPNFKEWYPKYQKLKAEGEESLDEYFKILSKEE